jgi:hypothetical protein
VAAMGDFKELLAALSRVPQSESGKAAIISGSVSLDE